MEYSPITPHSYGILSHSPPFFPQFPPDPVTDPCWRRSRGREGREGREGKGGKRIQGGKGREEDPGAIPESAPGPAPSGGSGQENPDSAESSAANPGINAGREGAAAPGRHRQGQERGQGWAQGHRDREGSFHWDQDRGHGPGEPLEPLEEGNCRGKMEL